MIEAVRSEFDSCLIGCKAIAPRTWVMGDRESSDSPDLTRLWVSPAPGGAYSAFGRIELRWEPALAVVVVKTLRGIIYSKSQWVTHDFGFCDPDFPDNVFHFIRQAATRSQRCFDLAHARAWRNYARTLHTSGKR